MTNHVDNSQAYLIIQGIRHFTPVQERAFFALLRKMTGMDGRVACLSVSTPDILRKAQKIVSESTRSQLDAIATGSRDFDAQAEAIILRPVQEFCLSSSQHRVAGWAAAGLTDKQIGVILGVASNTVRVHLKQVFAKLRVHNRHSLAKLLRPQTRVGFHSATLQPDLLELSRLFYEGNEHKEVGETLGLTEQDVKNKVAVAKRVTCTPTVAGLAAWYYQTQVRDVEDDPTGGLRVQEAGEPAEG